MLGLLVALLLSMSFCLHFSVKFTCFLFQNLKRPFFAGAGMPILMPEEPIVYFTGIPAYSSFWDPPLSCL